MPSVRNQSDAQPQTASNTVLFEMMMHYKRRMEFAESECEHQKKRARIIEEVWEEEIQERERQLDAMRLEMRQLVAANVRGAEMVVRKHDAGMRLMTAIEDMYSAVDVADQLAPPAERWVIDYVAMHKQAIQQRTNLAFDLLISEPGMGPVVDDEFVDGLDLVAREVLDRSGDTTEEETDSEEEIEV